MFDNYFPCQVQLLGETIFVCLCVHEGKINLQYHYSLDI